MDNNVGTKNIVNKPRHSSLLSEIYIEGEYVQLKIQIRWGMERWLCG